MDMDLDDDGFHLTNDLADAVHGSPEVVQDWSARGERADRSQGDRADLQNALRGARRAARPGDVDDVTQETLLASLRSGPSEVEQRGAWFRTVARRCAISITRRDTLRRDREYMYASARDQAVEAAEPLDPSPKLADAIARLRPEYRRIVELHYREGATLADIARMTGELPATVRTRHGRALRELRRSLTADTQQSKNRSGFGLGGAFLALRRLVERPVGVAAVLAIPIAVLAAVLLTAPEDGARSSDTISDIARSSDSAIPLDAVDLSSLESKGAPLSGAAERGRLEAPSATRRVRVIDLAREPVEGAAIYTVDDLVGGTPRLAGVTDAGGRATIDCDAGWSFAFHEAHGRSWAALLESDQREWRLKLRPADRVIRGVVVDSIGAPVPNASIRALAQATGRLRRNFNRTVGVGAPVLATSGPDGTFELNVHSAWRRAWLHVSCSGFGVHDEVFDTETGDAELRLTRAATPNDFRSIHLQDQRGEPLVGWKVFRRSTTTPPGDVILRAVASVGELRPFITDGNGDFDLPHRLRDSYEIESASQQELLAAAPDDPVGETMARELVSEQGSTWTIDTDRNARRTLEVQAPEGAEVYVSGPGLVRPLRAKRTETAGVFRVGPLPLGPLRIEGWIGREVQLRGEQIELVPGDGPQAIEIKALRGRVIRVRVEPEGPTPLGRVSLHRIPSAQLAGVGGDAEGHVGATRLSAHRLGAEPVRIPVGGAGTIRVAVQEFGGGAGFEEIFLEDDGPYEVEVVVRLRDVAHLPIRFPAVPVAKLSAYEVLDAGGEVIWQSAGVAPRPNGTRTFYVHPEARSIRMTDHLGHQLEFALDGWPFGDPANLTAFPRSTPR